MSDNPYESPQADINGINPLAAQPRLTETMIRYLKGSSPWLRFLGILGFIGAGGTMLGGLLFLIAGTLGRGFFTAVLSEQMEIAAETGDIGIVSGLTVFSGILIVITGIICLFPARFIYNFGNRIKNFLQNNSEGELERALKNNKSLWKFVGIVTIIYLAFLPVMFVFSIIAIISA
ncbi:MAG: DUF5362 family protein [Spirochaetaceae bacterium]|jgi:hypothetical protein|nr:DUF5362 family protein [Spirochaetaceae bacterium]